MNSIKNGRNSKRKLKKMITPSKEKENKLDANIVAGNGRIISDLHPNNVKVEENGGLIVKKLDDNVAKTMVEENGVKPLARKNEEKKELVAKLISAVYEDNYVPKHQEGPDYIIPSDSIRCWMPDAAKKLVVTPDMEKPLSLVTYLRNTMDRFPSRNALVIKRNGRWIKWTYTKYWEDVCTAAKGFIKLGLEPLTGVAILGFNAPEWVISNLAASFAGGFGTGIYTTNAPEACWYVLNDSKARIVVVENELQLKKILEIRHRLPDLKAIIQYTGESDEPDVLSWDDLLKIGQSLPDQVLEKRIKGLAINQCCSLIYTSGTTGVPKGVMLCHDTYSFVSRKLNQAINMNPGHDSVVSYLPLSHVAAQIVDVYMGIGGAVELFFAPPEALRGGLVDTLQEVKPTRFLGVPRVYEKIYEKIMEAEGSMSFIKRHALSWARNISLSHNQYKKNGFFSPSIFFDIANRTVLRKVREALGFHRVVTCASGAAPMSREVIDFFKSLNLIIFETYGLSECSAHAINTEPRIGSCGKIVEELEAKIEKPDEEGNGEICIRGRNIFMGYYCQQEKTEEAIDEEGWFHTGDIGVLDKDNYLYVTGRLKELLITAGGENVAPVPIEDRVKAHIPIVSNCVLIGDKRKFLSLMITLKAEIDTNTLQSLDELAPVTVKWCQSVGSNANTVTDILDGPDTKVMTAIQEGIDRVNKEAISNAQRIQKWTILRKDFSIPGGELGPTLKLKRAVVMNKYSQEIECLYDV